MDFQIAQVLERSELQQIVSSLARQAFTDGKLTASGFARRVKNNLQASRTGPQITEIDQIIFSAFRRNEVIQSFAMPRRQTLPQFSRYDPGMEYGSHVDAAVIGMGNDAMRADLASTLFLSDPAAYDGGELVLELPSGAQEIKLEAGEAIVYSATSLHRVAPVTKGSRLVALTWIQSTVPDERLRSILFDLHIALKQADAGGDAGLTTSLSRSYHNLLRFAVSL
jgi:PKHD-type hydroxylase